MLETYAKGASKIFPSFVEHPVIENCTVEVILRLWPSASKVAKTRNKQSHYCKVVPSVPIASIIDMKHGAQNVLAVSL